MTTIGWIQIVVFALVMFLITKPLGIYLFKVFEGPQPLPAVLGRIERFVLRLCGVDPKIEQTVRYQGKGSIEQFGLERFRTGKLLPTTRLI